MKANITQQRLDEQRAEIGNSIREVRHLRKMTQPDLAALTGMGVTQISKIESGKANIGIDTLTLFAEHLKFKITIKA